MASQQQQKQGDKHQNSGDGIKRIEVKLVCSLTHNYGPVSVTFGMEKIVYIGTIAEKNREFDKMVSAMNDEHARYRAERLLDDMTPPHPSGTTQEETAINRAIVDRFTLDKINGEDVYKARFGRFNKHGIRVWPEVVKRYKLDKLLDGRASVAVRGVQVVYIREDKTYKVTEIDYTEGFDDSIIEEETS